MWLSGCRVTTKVTTVPCDRIGSDGVNPKFRVVPITQLVLDEKNANKGTKRGIRTSSLKSAHGRTLQEHLVRSLVPIV